MDRKTPLGCLKSGLKRFFITDFQYPLSFAIPALILLLAYFIFGVYPFGKESVLSLDLNGQYVYYYDYMYDVFAGKESVFYSWSRNLSGEFMGIVGYYLGSPFNFLVWAFPREMITEGLLTMLVTKVGAIGLCTSIYFRRGKGFRPLTCIVFSASYALCAYTMVQTMNPMWLDGVMILPLIVYGIEKLIDEGKFVMLTISLVYAFVTCFYIGFMIAIFSAIYFLYYAVVSHKKGMARLFIERGFLFTGVAAVSTMMSMYMLLPVYHSLSYGKFDFSEPDYSSVYTNFDLIELLDKMFPLTYDTVRMSGLPFLYCGTLVLLFLPCYFFLKKIRGRDRIGGAAILSILCLSMYICQVDMLWHGGQLPNWLPYRYSFMVSFLMVAFSARAFDALDEVPKKHIALAALAWFAVLLWIEKQDNYLDDISRDTMDSLQVILPAAAILFIVAAVTVQFKNKLRRKGIAVIFVTVISLEIFANTFVQLIRQDLDIVYSTRPSYVDVIVPTREVVDRIKAEDDGFYRIEKTYFRTVNDPLACGMYGLSHSSSTLNAKPIELLSRLGFTSRSHYTRYSGATEITKSLFGVKYELSCPDNSTSEIESADDITVTENLYYLPPAYLVDKRVEDLELSATEPLRNQNMLLAAMLGRATDGVSDDDYFKRIIDDVDLELTNVTQGKTTDGHHSFKKIEPNLNTELVYTLEMPETSALYMYLPSRYERTVNVWLNREIFLGTYFEGDNNSIMKIGDFEKGESVTIGLTLTRDDLYFREAQFLYCDHEAIGRDLGELIDKNRDTTVERTSPTSLKITVNAAEDGLVFTSVPVERGWTILVDGAEVEYVELLDALIGVPVGAGSHTIEMKFVTAGYPTALIITGEGLILFIAMILVARFLKRKSAKKAALAEIDDPSAEGAETAAAVENQSQSHTLTEEGFANAAFPDGGEGEEISDDMEDAPPPDEGNR
ncbi:MAG: YfhO family protein [Bacteroides sp.]|nr:YfhO family protein [Eubacterium sp.]MCM1418502.1 YfhO family protein [Roseburia sp.]MCM1462521.1 YfhO family protein [Bacteroides sp.]